MALILVTPPSVEPVLLTELKDFLRIDSGDTSNDAVITALGAAARSWAEAFTQRRFINQTWRLMFDYFPGYIDSKISGSKISSPFISGPNAVLVGLRYAIVLPYPQVQSITTFTYLNASGGSTTMTAGTNYIADLSSQPARLTPPFGQMWPVARVVANAVSIDYVCGYGADGTSVPELIKLAIKLLVSHWYENRLPDEIDIPKAVKVVLAPYRDLRF